MTSEVHGMFSGETGKRMMINQGYVPETCTLDPMVAGPLIWSEINAGRSPCWGCNSDRTICKGQPLDMERYRASKHKVPA